MIPEFIDFCQELFPCIDPYTREQAKLAMTQFEGVNGPVLTKQYDSFDLFQGDIFSEIPFFYVNEAGQLKKVMRKAQLLSNTCDASRDDLLLFAAIHPLSDYSDKPSMVDTIMKNKKFNAFYLPDHRLQNEYIDFELICSMPRTAFLKLCEIGKVNRIASLNLVGYYMFLCKMTVFFMRPEDEIVNASRDTTT